VREVLPFNDQLRDVCLGSQLDSETKDGLVQFTCYEVGFDTAFKKTSKASLSSESGLLRLCAVIQDVRATYIL
jgi:hypothetical protein